MNGQFRAVVDTHALWWYLKSPERLSAAATAVFRLAETGNAVIVVPAIAVAEFYYLSVKLGQAFTPTHLLAVLDSVGGVELSDLGRDQLERLDRHLEIPEMHDRLIAAEAATLDAPVVTRDATLTASTQIETIW
jgi:PIN domain nuclease of toxin-antitoxin system